MAVAVFRQTWTADGLGYLRELKFGERCEALVSPLETTEQGEKEGKTSGEEKQHHQ